MRTRQVVIAVAALVAAAAGYWVFGRASSAGERRYRLVAIERGDVESVVTATGTLNPLETVEVGTQVSGIVSQLLVDYNDHVRKGQVVARIDTTLLEIAVRDAEAALARGRAQLDNARRSWDRARTLHTDGILSEADWNQAQYDLETAEAAVRSAEVGVDRARKNLEYATIYAPISGTVIERDVDVGQTVAASFSSPRLYVIAKDLTRMQIEASVDESDIGRVRPGQEVRFTVQADPERSFRGTVRQIRLNPKTVENVVDYTVVIDVANPDGVLLPGMTATVDFLVGSAHGVLKVSNAALRFRPSGTESRAADSGQRGAATPKAAARLWYVGADGKLAAAHVRTGITDGRFTEIDGADVSEGMKVVAGVSGPISETATNPFQSGSGRRFGPPGP